MFYNIQFARCVIWTRRSNRAYTWLTTYFTNVLVWSLDVKFIHIQHFFKFRYRFLVGFSNFIIIDPVSFEIVSLKILAWNVHRICGTCRKKMFNNLIWKYTISLLSEIYTFFEINYQSWIYVTGFFDVFLIVDNTVTIYRVHRSFSWGSHWSF